MSELLDLDELREAIGSVLRDLGGDTPHIPGEDGRGLDRALWDEMASLGWLSLSMAERDGGLGQGIAHLGVLYEELGRVLASVPVLPTMLVVAAIAAHGDDAVRGRWLPAIASGAVLAASALRDDAPGATIDGDGCLTGSIDHVSFADVATLLAMPVRRDGAVIGLALVPADAQGVNITRRPLVDLTRSAARVELDCVANDAVTILPIDDAAWEALADHAAVALACDAIGASTDLINRTVDYLKVREQFGRPIGSFQALKHRAADWQVKIDAATALVRHAAALLAAGDAAASATASGAKAYACNLFAAFAADAVQLHGGIGFTWEHPCHLFLKRAKLSQQLHGSVTAHKERAARLAFGRGCD